MDFHFPHLTFMQLRTKSKLPNSSQQDTITNLKSNHKKQQQKFKLNKKKTQKWNKNKNLHSHLAQTPAHTLKIKHHKQDHKTKLKIRTQHSKIKIRAYQNQHSEVSTTQVQRCKVNKDEDSKSEIDDGN